MSQYCVTSAATIRQSSSHTYPRLSLNDSIADICLSDLGDNEFSAINLDFFHFLNEKYYIQPGAAWSCGSVLQGTCTISDHQLNQLDGCPSDLTLSTSLRMYGIWYMLLPSHVV